MNVTINKKSSFSFEFVGKYNFCEVKIKSTNLFSGYLISNKLQREAMRDIKNLKDETPFVRKEMCSEIVFDCEKTPYMILINGNDESIIVEISVSYFPMNYGRTYTTSGFGI